MPISLSCPQCHKIYQLSDSLAGKKARCKDCGTVFQIPAPKVVKAPPSVDLFDGLEDGEPVPRQAPSRSTSTKFGALTVAEGETGRVSGVSKPKRRVAVDHAGQEAFRRTGIGMMGFGFVSFLLPLVGLQFRLLAFIPESAQTVIATIVIVAGLGSLLLSFTPQPSRWFARAALGVVATIALILAAIFIPVWMRGGIRAQEKAPLPGVAGQPDVPAPRFIHPLPANIPNPAPTPPSIETRDSNPDEQLYTLSNATAERESGPGVMIRELMFKVDYQAKGSAIAGPPLFWVIESNQTKANRRMIGVDPRSGTLSGTITVTGEDTGPFKTYLARETFGPGGKSRVKVSNVVDVQWLGERAANDSMIPPPSAQPPTNGPPGTRRPFPNGMPGRPGFPRRPGPP